MSVHFSKLDDQPDPYGIFGINQVENEQSGVNANQYPNYQSNLHTSKIGQHTENDSNNPINDQVIDDEEEDIQDLEGKKAKNFTEFIYKNNQQFKAIGGGE